MKGLLITNLRLLIIAIVGAAVLIGSILIITQIDILGVLKGTCGDNVCESEIGETPNNCPLDCEQFSYSFLPGHLVVDPIAEDTYSVSDLNEYISFYNEGKEDLKDCQNGKVCKDILFFENNSVCSRCEACDPVAEECGFCDSCKEGKSDYSLDTRKYENMSTCYLCKECNVDSITGTAENCNACETCETSNIVENVQKNYNRCDFCSNSDPNLQNAKGCISCYNNPKPDETIALYNICEEADSCNFYEQQSEPIFCERLKECIIDYGNQVCDIDLDISVIGGNINTTTENLTLNIQDAVEKCRLENLYREVEGGSQVVCKFQPSTLSISNMKFDDNAVYTECGTTTPIKLVNGTTITHSNNLIVSNAFAFGNPPGVHYTITTGNVSYTSGGSNICDYNLFVCGQAAVGTDDNDKVLDVYKGILSIDWEQYFPKTPQSLAIDTNNDLIDYQWKIVKFPSFNVNLNIAKNKYEITNTIIAGLRDLDILIREHPETIQTLCKVVGLTNEQCAQVTFTEINRFIPWEMCERPLGGIEGDAVLVTTEDRNNPNENRFNYIAGVTGRKEVPVDLGHITNGADIVVRDLNNDGKLDVVLLMLDRPSNNNHFEYVLGIDCNFDNDNNLNCNWGGRQDVSGNFENDKEGAGMVFWDDRTILFVTVNNLNGPNKFDYIIHAGCSLNQTDKTIRCSDAGSKKTLGRDLGHDTSGAGVDVIPGSGSTKDLVFVTTDQRTSPQENVFDYVIVKGCSITADNSLSCSNIGSRHSVPKNLNDNTNGADIRFLDYNNNNIPDVILTTTTRKLSIVFIPNPFRLTIPVLIDANIFQYVIGTDCSFTSDTMSCTWSEAKDLPLPLGAGIFTSGTINFGTRIYGAGIDFPTSNSKLPVRLFDLMFLDLANVNKKYICNVPTVSGNYQGNLEVSTSFFMRAHEYSPNKRSIELVPFITFFPGD